MDTKLTLKLKKDVIKKAKSYARAKNTSISRLVENYLSKITAKPEDFDITPLVKSLSGILNENDLTNNKKYFFNYLDNKYK